MGVAWKLYWLMWLVTSGEPGEYWKLYPLFDDTFTVPPAPERMLSINPAAVETGLAPLGMGARYCNAAVNPAL